MSLLAVVLWPIMAVMELLLDAYFAVSGSRGLAIILLSMTVRLATSPLSRMGAGYSERERSIQARMRPAISEARATLTGRERFERIDAIYTENGYHPIQSMASLLPLAIQIPFLLAALFLLADHPPLQGVPFLFVQDLGLPDGLLPLPFLGILVNLLPLALTGVSIMEVMIDPAQGQARLRFIVVAVVLVVLIYPLPAAVCLYWLTSNVWSLTAFVKRNCGMSGKGAQGIDQPVHDRLRLPVVVAQEHREPADPFDQ